MTGRVAVVMPCYNMERWVGSALTSLLHQDYDNYKIFVIDDGSTDKSQSIVRDLEARYPGRVQVFAQINGGCGRALNTGFDAANAEGGYDYGTMVSADNLYYPNFISSLAMALDLEPKSVAMVYGDFNYINERNQIINTLIHQEKDKTDLINGYDQGAAFMFRMEAKNKAGNYWRRICEDYPMAVRIAQHGEFRLVSLVLMAFRASNSQLTGSNVKEEELAAEYSRRLARKLLLGDETISLSSVYPEGVDPWLDRYDEDAAKRDGNNIGCILTGGLDDVEN